VSGQAEKIMAHLDHYLVSERVTLEDRSDEWVELYLGGPQSAAVVAQAIHADPPRQRLAHSTAKIDGRDAWIRRADLTSPNGYLIAAACDDAEAIWAAINKHGAKTATPEAFEAARIEQGFPLFARDVTDKNFPQEIGRDPLAISFKKGCYLGQETVARIDALGHVNQSLVAVKFDVANVPSVGTILSVAGQTVGHVTSAAYSPKLGRPLALAFVRRGHNVAGTQLESASGVAEVIASPA
jgi:folate-binding protein YgfZ